MSLGRRRFLTVLGGGGAAAAAGAALPGCAPTNGPAHSVTIREQVSGGAVTFDPASYGDLARAGGAVIADVPGYDAVLIVHAGTGDYRAFSAICTHQGCPLGYEAPDIVCPCHQSHFEPATGLPTRGPATAALRAYVVLYTAGTGEITLVLSDFPALVGGVLTLPFAQFPALATPGGSVSGRPAGYPNDLLVIALAGGGYAAVDARCPHQGCTVGFPAGGAGDVVCPCHGSRFGTDGTLKLGPATVGLPAFAASATADAVLVTVTA